MQRTTLSKRVSRFMPLILGMTTNTAQPSRKKITKSRSRASRYDATPLNRGRIARPTRRGVKRCELLLLGNYWSLLFLVICFTSP